MAQEKPANQNVPEEEKDLKERIDGFNKELLPLLGKYELGLAALAKILPDGRVAADPIIVSVRKQMRENKEKEAATAGAPAQPATPPAPSSGITNPDA